MVLVFLTLLIGYRSPKLVIATVVTLSIGLVFSLYFATVAIGHLNLISIGFAVLFIGMGDATPPISACATATDGTRHDHARIAAGNPQLHRLGVDPVHLHRSMGLFASCPPITWAYRNWASSLASACSSPWAPPSPCCRRC